MNAFSVFGFGLSEFVKLPDFPEGAAISEEVHFSKSDKVSPKLNWELGAD